MAGMASTAADQMLHLVKACIVNPNATVADREANFQNLTGYAVDNIVDDGTHLGKPSENAEPTDDSGWQKATTENSPFGTVMSQFISDEDTEIYVSSSSECGQNQFTFRLIQELIPVLPRFPARCVSMWK